MYNFKTLSAYRAGHFSMNTTSYAMLHLTSYINSLRVYFNGHCSLDNHAGHLSGPLCNREKKILRIKYRIGFPEICHPSPRTLTRKLRGENAPGIPARETPATHLADFRGKVRVNGFS